MQKAGAPGDGAAPPQASEQIHLPKPSYLPVVVAFALTIALVGVVLSWALTGIGLILLAVATLRWIRQTREEIATLPLAGSPPLPHPGNAAIPPGKRIDA